MSNAAAQPKSPAFQYFPADFLADKNVAVMTTAEVGAYWLLISYCWREDGLPDDLEELAALARLPVKEFTRTWERRIRRCFLQREDGTWTHSRLEEERSKQAAWREKSREGGKRSAESRKGGARVVQPKSSQSSGNDQPNDKDRSRMPEPRANSSSSSSSSTSSSSHTRAEATAAPLREGVCSKFSFEQCLEYAEYLKAAGQAVHSPGGLASKLQETGRSDNLIEKYFEDKARKSIDLSQCPDCKGKGMRYKDLTSPDSGVMKCKHEKLAAFAQTSAATT